MTNKAIQNSPALLEPFKEYINGLDPKLVKVILAKYIKPHDFDFAIASKRGDLYEALQSINIDTDALGLIEELSDSADANSHEAQLVGEESECAFAEFDS